MDIHSYPLRNPQTGRENRVYHANGRRIPRFNAIIDFDEQDPCGILMNLETIPSIFHQSTHAYDGDFPLVTVFPQAFTRRFGNVQSQAVLPAFNIIARQIDTIVGTPLPNAVGNGDEDLPEVNENVFQVVEPMGSQLYNHLSHRTRHSSQLHDVQRGMITSALAGAYFISGAGNVTFGSRVNYCNNSLPHQTFNSQISPDASIESPPSPPRAERCENVWTIHVQKLKREYRRGE